MAYSQLGTSLLLLIATTAVFCLPNPMAQSDGSPTKETDKCDRFAYEEWIGDQVACETEAGNELKTVLSSFDFTDDQLRQGLCSQIRGRMACMDKNGPTCFNQDSIDGIKLNIIFKEFQRFFNMTETLGRELIDNCPTMVKYEVQLMQELAGSNRCNFHEYETSRIKMQACRTEAQEKRSFRLKLLDVAPNPREFLAQIVCTEKADFLSCSQAFKTCKGGAELQEILDDEEGYFANIGGQVTELIPEFNIDTSCNADGSVSLGSPRDGEFGVDTGLTASSSKKALEKLRAFR